MVFHRMKQIMMLSLLVFVLCCFGCQKEVGAGAAAPEFILPDLSGNEVSLRQLRGRVVLVDFWATWCGPCLISIPELISLQEKYRPKGLIILGISLDDKSQASDEYLRSFKERHNINYSVLRADHKTVRSYFRSGQVAIPTAFVIDRQGNVRDKIVGVMPDALEKSVERVIE